MTDTALVERACWCGATAAHHLGRFQSKHALVQCDGCGVLALFPQPTEDELAAAYSSEYYGSTRRKFVAPVAAIVSLFQGGRARMITRRVPKGGHVLDVGCGNGGFLLQLRNRGYHVEGTEWTADSAARATAEGDFPVHIGDLVELDLPRESFDAVTLWHVFEHLRRPRETLESIRTLLRPGGVVLMSMPNAESAQAERYGPHWFHHDPPRHLFGFGPHSITQLLQDAGFQVVGRIRTWSFEQNPFGEIQSALNARGFPRDRLYAQLKGLSSSSLGERWSDLVRGAIRLPGAIVRDVIDSSRGYGATMTIEARRP